MGNPFIFAVRFLKEVNVEMKKVKWPSKNELIEYTIVVLVISAVVGIYLGALDFIFNAGFEWVLNQFSGNELPTVTEPVDGTTTDPVAPEDPNTATGEQDNEQATGNENEQSEETTGTEPTNNN